MGWVGRLSPRQQRDDRHRVWIVAGTRPEIIKLAPVYRALHQHPEFVVLWVATGQHTDLAEQAQAFFGITPDLQLQLDRDARPPAQASGASGGVAVVFADLVRSVDAALSLNKPSLVVVQGDTTSSVAAAIAAFAQRVPVAHVEAGLRTFDLSKPFPEEAWRAIISQIADFHFAPTKRAAKNLRTAGVQREAIWITGNTVVDALQWLASKLPTIEKRANGSAANRRVLVTLHRRENWEGAFERVCTALITLRDQVPDISINFVGHANPALWQAAKAGLENQARIHLLPPLDYPKFITELRASTLVLSDSGGVQEEAPSFGVPVLVLRESTERPEAIEAGVAALVGTDPARIVRVARRLLTDKRAYARMSPRRNPFGDGHASERIATRLLRQLKFRERKHAGWLAWH